MSLHVCVCGGVFIGSNIKLLGSISVFLLEEVH